MEGDLFKPLPEELQNKAREFGFKENPSVDFVRSFLETSERPIKDHELTQLGHKSQQLDNNKERRKKKFNKGPGKCKKLTVKEKSELNLFQLNKTADYGYEDYEFMNSLWMDYIKELISFHSITERNLPQLTSKLLRADYHGSILTVLRSKTPSYVGATGIVIQETRNMFRFVTKANKLKSIPKAHSVFLLDICGYQFKIYGNQFQVNASERVRRRFKLKATIDL